MRSKLIAVLLMAFLLGIDAAAFAKFVARSTAFTPDGVPAISQRQKRRRAQRRRWSRRKPKVYSIGVPPKVGPMQKGAEPTAAEPTEAAPNVAPAPAPSINLDIPGAQRQSAPKIKPPTVQIKPPTE